MNIYAENDYRKILAASLQEKKSIDSQLNFQRMAEAIRVQKSYLSNVLKGRSQLSADQLFLASNFLGFSIEQANYLNLLLEYDRSGVQDRKVILKKEITRIQTEQLESKAHLTAERIDLSPEKLFEYYLNPLHAIIHNALSIERYRRNPALLVDDLNVKAEHVERSIAVLEKCQIIQRRRTGRAIELILDHIHLPRESAVYPAFRNQLKQMSIARLQNNEENDYSFWVTFSADDKTLLKLKQEFLALLKKTEASVRKAPAQNVYQMNFDLFSWTRNR